MLSLLRILQSWTIMLPLLGLGHSRQFCKPYHAVLQKAGIGSTAELRTRVQTCTENTFVARLAKVSGTPILDSYADIGIMQRFADDLTFVREFALNRVIKQLQTEVSV